MRIIIIISVYFLGLLLLFFGLIGFFVWFQKFTLKWFLITLQELGIYQQFFTE